MVATIFRHLFVMQQVRYDMYSAVAATGQVESLSMSLRPSQSKESYLQTGYCPRPVLDRCPVSRCVRADGNGDAAQLRLAYHCIFILVMLAPSAPLEIPTRARLRRWLV